MSYNPTEIGTEWVILPVYSYVHAQTASGLELVSSETRNQVCGLRLPRDLGELLRDNERLFWSSVTKLVAVPKHGTFVVTRRKQRPPGPTDVLRDRHGADGVVRYRNNTIELVTVEECLAPTEVLRRVLDSKVGLARG